MLALPHSNEPAIVLNRRPEWSRAGGTAVAEPFAGATLATYDSREDLFLEGDEATHLFEILEGMVCAYRLLPDGTRHVVSFYFPGDLIGYCCIGVYPFNAQGLGEVRVRRIPRASIDRMVERRPDFARRLLRLAADELVATRDHLLCVAAKSAEAKMAAFLLALSERNEQAGGDPRRFELRMTRIDIGDYLGLTIETVSRTLSKLKRADIIGLPQTNLVVIHDVARLRQIALS
jgi:CRP/FNR family transcriptional regulator